MADFVHLHVHSHYSLLDGACRPEALAARAKECHMPALALTDHGNLFGAVEFYKACEHAGVKPIIGYEAYVAPHSRTDRDATAISEAGHHLTLLAGGNSGYKNLLKLASIAYLDGFYYRPRVDKELLVVHSKGLVAMSGCLSGEIPGLLLAGRGAEARKVAGFYREIFGPDHFFLEIQRNGIPEQEQANRLLAELSAQTGIPLVATADLHYLRREDAAAHDVLLCIQTGKKLSDVNRLRFATDQFYFKTPAEMQAEFADFPGAVRRSVEIAERCDVALDFKSRHMPVFRAPGGQPPAEYLRRIGMEGLRRRCGASVPQEAQRRFEHEIEVINRMGFASYYLIVWDFVREARSRGIPVGPGRGSGAGSIVAYALGITDLDPLKYGLYFERFLNEGRNDPPDFDIDICQQRRGEVIDYVTNRYGRDNVAQIITFGTMAARAAIRDAGRVLEVPLPEVDKIAKLVPQGPKVTLKGALESEKELREQYKSNQAVTRLLDIAMKIEGLVRNAGTHAAGVVIADRPLTNYVPLYKPSGEEAISTQYEMKMIGELGLLKMDFLGLQTLTVIDQAVKLVGARSGSAVPDPLKFPLDEKRVYELLARGATRGIFQMESSGMTELVVRLKPDRFEDLIALVALFRPGPLGSGMVEQYVDCKHGRHQASYRHPMMEPLLRETHGVILYQEQVQALAAVMAGFSLAEGDMLRRAMGKKIPEVMEKYRQKFIDGARRNGVSAEVAEQVFREIEFFAGYGFNKSHSACYALLAYQTAYLKAVHPLEFMAALLTCDSGNTDKVVTYIDECRQMDIAVLPPDVNASQAAFAPEGTAVRYGLAALKGVGQRAVEAIVEARNAGGAFKNLYDFCERVDARSANRAVLEALIKSGAFDSLGARRSQLSAVLDSAVAAGAGHARDRVSGQLSLLGGGLEMDQPDAAPALPDLPEWPEQKLLESEKAVLGFYLSRHPLASHEKLIRSYSTAGTARLNGLPDGAEVVTGGLIASLKYTVTKKDGRRMARIVLEDLDGSIEAVAFPRTFEAHAANLKVDAIVFLKGRADRKMERPSIIIDEVIPLAEARTRLAGSAVLRLQSAELTDELLGEIKGLFAAHRGNRPVFFLITSPDGTTTTVRAGSGGVRPTEELYGDLVALVGDGRVEFLPEGR